MSADHVVCGGAADSSLMAARRIGQLDFNMYNPFDLKQDKPPAEVKASGLFPPPHLYLMCMAESERWRSNVYDQPLSLFESI